MRISLDPEDGTKVEGQQDKRESVPPYLAGPSAAFGSKESQERVEGLIVAALSNQLPRERELLPHEASKLRPRHIAILMRIAAGMTIPEASERFRMTTVRIRTILQHPDSLKIMGALQAQQADKLSDVGARFQAYANEMLSVKVEILRTTKNEKLKSEIAGDILDRAGYGPRRKLDVDVSNKFIFPEAVARGLTSALQESDQIAVMDYQQYNKPLPEPQKILTSGAGESARPFELSEQHSMVGDASLTGDSSPDALRRSA